MNASKENDYSKLMQTQTPVDWADTFTPKKAIEQNRART